MITNDKPKPGVFPDEIIERFDPKSSMDHMFFPSLIDTMVGLNEINTKKYNYFANYKFKFTATSDISFISEITSNNDALKVAADTVHFDFLTDKNLSPKDEKIGLKKIASIRLLFLNEKKLESYSEIPFNFEFVRWLFMNWHQALKESRGAL